MRSVYRCCATLCLVTTLFAAAAQAQSLPAPPAAPPAANDSTANGIGIGVAVGAAAGFGLMHAAYNSCDNCEKPAAGPMYLSAMGMGAGVGAVTGWLIDRARKGKPATAKQKAISLAPIVGRNTRAMMVNIRY